MLFPMLWRNLRHRPARTLLTISGIAVGIGAFVALTSIARGFERTWVRVYAERGTDLIVNRAGSLSPVPPSFPVEQVSGLARTYPDVAGTSAMLTDVVGVEDTPVVLLFGWEPRTFVWNHLRLVSGRWPARDDEPVVLLGSIAVDALRKEVGSTVRVETTTFTVCGVFESGSLAENGAVLMTLPQLQQVTGQPGRINFFNMKLAPGTSADRAAEIRRDIAVRLPGFHALTAGDAAGRNVAIQLAKGMSAATALIAIVVGAIAVMNTVLMSVFERTHEIGVLASVGWRRPTIVRLILLESTALGALGGIAGAALGGAAVLLFARSSLLRGKIEPDFGVPLFALAIGIAVVLGAAGGIYPAWRAARMRPIEALRHE
jgi:putative ABC transport system permease protein